jgi:hypothetical protein
MLDTLEQAYRHPVDVEFTLHLDDKGEPRFNLVQCRPLATIGEATAVELPAAPDPRSVLLATEGHFMGGNINLPIHRIIQVLAGPYSALNIADKYQVAALVGRLARQTPEHSRLMLIGPGRWGTGSPELGVPVGFADISRVSVLVEIADMGNSMVPDLSFGSHFFQDLVETGIAYVALFPDEEGSLWQPQWLASHARPRAVDSLLDDEPPPRAVQACVRVWETDPEQFVVQADVTEQRLLAYTPNEQNACT